MKEDFLHFIWQFQHFDKSGLISTRGQELRILQTGIPNSDAGADFDLARLSINGVAWHGSVEIHLQSSDWYHHQHHQDEAYNTVVLHVVWEEDQPILREDGSFVPTLELKDRVEKAWLHRYQALQLNKSSIPCGSQIHQLDPIYLRAMLDKVLIERMEEKAFLLKALLVKNQGDWEESCYQLLAKNFGFKVNAEPFLRLSQSLPLKYIRKHRDQRLELEALLFGQAGFLDAPAPEGDIYFMELKKCYEFFKSKFRLPNPALNNSQWKFLRLRPANFPTLRIAQFAALLENHSHFASFFLHKDTDDIRKALRVHPSEYWLQHHHFGKKSKKVLAELGEQSQENIMINTVVPLLVRFARDKSNLYYLDKARLFLEKLKPENNKITREWQELDIQTNHAADSQALHQLYKNYCQKKKCLHCKVGLKLLKPEKEASLT